MTKRSILALASSALVAVMLPGAVAAAGPSTAWTRQFGTSSSEQAHDVATDSHRNQYVVGDTNGTLPGQTSQGNSDAFVRKYRPNGRLVWTRQFGTSGGDQATSVAMDRAGRIFVVGVTDGTFPGQTSQGSSDAFVRKYRPNGRLVWTRQFGSNGSDGAQDVVIDRAGRIFVSGITDATLPGQTTKGGYDAFVRMIRPNGSLAWIRQFGTNDFDVAQGISIDRAGRIFVSGYTAGAFPGQVSKGDLDTFVRMIRPNGRSGWTRQFGTSGGDTGGGIAIDRAGRIFVAGSTLGAFPGQTNKGGRDAFVRMIRPNGRTGWTRQFGTSGFDYAYGIATDRMGRIAVSGEADGTLPGQTSHGDIDAFVRLFRANGGTGWTRQFGTSGDDWANGIAIDRTGLIALAGLTEGTFPGQASQGGDDAFVRTYRQ